MIRRFTFTVVLALAAAGAAHAQSLEDERTPKKGFTVVPNVGATPGVILTLESLSRECQIKADGVLAGLFPREEGIAVCDAAISSLSLEPIDLAGAYNNRGTLYVATDTERAKLEFNKSIAAAPHLPEAYMNRGAVLVSQGRYDEGVADLDKAISIGNSRNLDKAHYHRGIGREMQGDIRGAYTDYRMASTLNPTWIEPQTELSRFQVVTR